MVQLDSGNVLLKPSHKRQCMAWLRRPMKIGRTIGGFQLTVSLHRSGRHVEARANVHDTHGDFGCRSRQHHWREAVRDLAREVSVRLGRQRHERPV